MEKGALERRTIDPDDAITAARALISSVCKHIFDELKNEYSDDADRSGKWGNEPR